MFGFQWADIAMIVGYFAAIIWIGVYAARKVKNQEDYFLGGRSFGKLIQTFAAFGQATSSDSAVGTTLLTARNGLSGVWTSLIGVFQIPMYWITSVWYRRLRLLTLGDFFEERYDSKKMAAVYGVFSAVFFMLVIGIGFVAMTKTIAAVGVKPIEKLTAEERVEYGQAQELVRLEAADVSTLSAVETAKLKTLRLQNPRSEFSYINETMLMWIAALVVVLYAAMGGLEAAFLTDTLQGIFILILSVLLIPFACFKINDIYGGAGISGIFETMRSQIPQAMFEVWGSPLNADFTWYYIAGLTLMSVVNVAVQANQLVCMGSAKDEHSAQVGFCSGIFIKRVCTLLWGGTALLLLVLYSGQVQNPEYLWGFAVRDLLGGLDIGLVGLMMACLMAGLMSTADALMITASGLLTHNVIRPFFPGRPEKTYVMIGRVAGAGVVFGSVILVSNFSHFIHLLKFLWEFNAVLAASFWLGMKWRRANRTGAWASIGTALSLFILLPVLIPLLPGVRTNAYLAKTVDPIRMERIYVAREADVEARQQEIAQWSGDGEAPAPLAEGDSFSKATYTSQESVFWTQGLQADSDGTVRGAGMLSVELVALDRLGWDLSKNSYALNETIRIIFRLLLPFLVLIGVSRLTPAVGSERLDRFFVRLRTPTSPDHAEDAREVAVSYSNPDRFRERLLFPSSDWELFKWTKNDWKGQSLIALGGATIFAALWLISLIGG